MPDDQLPNRQPKRMGRPTVPDADKLKPHTVHLTDEQWARIQRNGKAWLRTVLDRAKDPAPAAGGSNG